MIEVLLVTAGLLAGTGTPDDANAAALLRARHDELRGELAHNQFGQPLYLESTESATTLEGNIYAIVAHPYSTAGAALVKPAAWCDVLILHVNVKYCRAASDADRTVLTVYLGRKYFQTLEKAHRVDFEYAVAAFSPNYFDIRLHAPRGPFSTRNYLVRLEAIPIERNRTFLHLTYSYEYGASGRFAMNAYLDTLGRNKVGFTVVGRNSSGTPEYVDGTRGVLERNTMRYYLAIDAYLEALSRPGPQQPDRRLANWLAGTERYPQQLGDIERSDYFEMKRREESRQQAAP